MVAKRQLVTVAGLLDTLEKEQVCLHLQIHAMRSLAHTSGDETAERTADATLHASQVLLDALRDQHRQVADLSGQRMERLAAS